MERLTFEGLFCDIAMCQNTPGGSFCEDGACSQRKVWERLKAYEDTGCSPEDFDKLCRDMSDLRMAIGLRTYEAVRDVIKAGRLVVLPCKVGDTVYFLLEDLPVYYPETNGWWISEEEVTEICTSGLCVDPFGAFGEVRFYPFTDFGKTIFLTLEEAEAALKGGTV